MYKLEPIALTVENENTYKVRFKTETGEVEYRFTTKDEGFLSVGCEIPFATITNGDPAVPLLTQAIGNFHQARHYKYDLETEGSGDDRSGITEGRAASS
jgi:hypothetical protein